MAQQRAKDEWSDWVAKWRASGLSGTSFAARHGLSMSSLYRWARRLGERQPPSETVFAEVRVVGSEPRSSDAMIEIVTRSGRVIRVVGEVDVQQLRAVLEVVERC